MNNYKLGIDLGSSSLGFACIELDENNKPIGLLDIGVRIFSDGRNDKTKESLCVARRGFRGTRRNLDRYILRRKNLMNCLIDCGFMPKSKEERKELELEKPRELKNNNVVKEKISLHELRNNAVEGGISPYELGRVLFYLNKKRGFKSKRKPI